MSLKSSLGQRPVIYEIVPPRRDSSRFSTELRGVEEVLSDGRIRAINIPELIKRVETKEGVRYSPAAMPPEHYAMLLGGRKEAIIDFIAPRMTGDELVRRSEAAVRDYGVPNLLVVGKERRGDRLPGPGVIDAVRMLRKRGLPGGLLGGICIFDRSTGPEPEYGYTGEKLTEARRVLLKAKAGCDFVASQICFDPKAALEFLTSYHTLCADDGVDPVTVVVSLATAPSASILALIERLDVVIPTKYRKCLEHAGDIGKESLRIAAEVFERVVEGAERLAPGVPLGLQVEQVGVSNDRLSLELLDRVHPLFKP